MNNKSILIPVLRFYKTDIKDGNRISISSLKRELEINGLPKTDFECYSLFVYINNYIEYQTDIVKENRNNFIRFNNNLIYKNNLLIHLTFI